MGLKAFAKKVPGVRRIYRALFRPENVFSSRYWIGKTIPDEPRTIVQIGAYDGVSGDPIHDLAKQNRAWTVLFVEPVPASFERLKTNYGTEPRFRFENAAINTNGIRQPFYVVDDEAFSANPNLSEDYRQISSFDKDHVLNLSGGLVDAFVTELDVHCLTLEQLLKKHEVEQLDVLLIDAEGYDWKILSQLDVESFQPDIIVFESCNLEEGEKRQALEFLHSRYELFGFRIDTFCIRRGVLNPEQAALLASKRL